MAGEIAERDRAAGAAPVASATVDEPPGGTRWPVLRAMARNYTAGKHTWDALDADACEQAAEEIRHLRAALASAPVGLGWQPIKDAPQGVRVLLGPRHAPVVGIVKHYEDADSEEPAIVCNVVHYNGSVLVADYRTGEWAPLASAPVAGEAQRRDNFLPEHVTQQMIWNVQAVIEAECNGLALDARQARNVMSFLMNEHGPDAAPQASEAVRNALMAFDEAMILCGDFPELQHHRDALLFAVQKARAALSATQTEQGEREDG